MNFYSLFEGPSVQDDGGLDGLTKRAGIAARSYIDSKHHGFIKKGFENLARALAKDRETKSQATYNAVNSALGNLAQYSVSPSSILDVANDRYVLNAYKSLLKRRGTDVKNVSDLDQDLQARIGSVTSSIDPSKYPDGVEPYPDSRDTNYSVKAIYMYKDYLEMKVYTAELFLGNLILATIDTQHPEFLKRLNTPLRLLQKMAIDEASKWIESVKNNKHMKDSYSHVNAWGVDLWIPIKQEVGNLATQVLLQAKQRFYPEESINESYSQKETVQKVGDYMHFHHHDIFTKYGVGYVMSVIEDVVNKWHNAEDPVMDRKAYALEVLDALGVDRTNENRAQIKTDYKGHHLTNADGEKVASYPKNPEGLKKARNTLYINHKGLNTMKQEGLNEAFEAELQKLSLNESVTINTTTSSEGQDTVTVTATDEDAYELVNILKAAGIPHDKAEQYAPAPCDAAIAMPMEEEYVNEPHDDCCNGDMDHMNTQSGGLNRRKVQQKYANPLGDNPLAESEDLLRGLWDLYKEAK